MLLYQRLVLQLNHMLLKGKKYIPQAIPNIPNTECIPWYTEKESCKINVVSCCPAVVWKSWMWTTILSHDRSAHLIQHRPGSLSPSTSPMSLPAPLGPQLKTPLMSSNWQRLHHFHTSLSTESGIKMLEAEWTIDFLRFFPSIWSLQFLQRPIFVMQVELGSNNQFTTLCCLHF